MAMKSVRASGGDGEAISSLVQQLRLLPASENFTNGRPIQTDLGMTILQNLTVVRLHSSWITSQISRVAEHSIHRFRGWFPSVRSVTIGRLEDFKSMGRDVSNRFPPISWCQALWFLTLPAISDVSFNSIFPLANLTDVHVEPYLTARMLRLAELPSPTLRTFHADACLILKPEREEILTILGGSAPMKKLDVGFRSYGAFPAPEHALLAPENLDIVNWINTRMEADEKTLRLCDSEANTFMAYTGDSKFTKALFNIKVVKQWANVPSPSCMSSRLSNQTALRFMLKLLPWEPSSNWGHRLSGWICNHQ